MSVLCRVAAALLVVLAAVAGAAQGSERPNILFVFADDLCYELPGSDEVRTPNLDRLARGSLRFSHAYNMGSWTGAVCVASRTMLNTGRFLWRAYELDNKKILEREREAGRFWAELMRRAGYDTYFSGKWHVKADAEQAFDFVTHVRPGMPKQTPEGYNRPIEGQPDPWKPWDRKFGGYWEGGKHWSEVLGDDAVGFIEQAAERERPFFMYLAFNAPHDPRQSPKRYVDMYPLERIRVPENFLPEYPYNEDMACGRKLRDERLAPFPRTPYAVKVHRQEYYAITTHMDAQLGRILDALERSGKADNTYVLFSADHGLAVGHHGLMGKQNLFDHSVRVPFFVRGPGMPEGETLDAPIYLQDIMPTTLELAGVRPPDFVQFRSVLPLVRGQRRRSYDAIYGAYLDAQRMVTADGYKLILYPRIAKALLFNLREDPLEMRDLAERSESLPVMRRLFAELLKLQRETGDELDLQAVYPQLATAARASGR